MKKGLSVMASLGGGQQVSNQLSSDTSLLRSVCAFAISMFVQILCCQSVKFFQCPPSSCQMDMEDKNLGSRILNKHKHHSPVVVLIGVFSGNAKLQYYLLQSLSKCPNQNIQVLIKLIIPVHNTIYRLPWNRSLQQFYVQKCIWQCTSYIATE